MVSVLLLCPSCGLTTDTVRNGTYSVKSNCPDATSTGEMSIYIPRLGDNYASFGFPDSTLHEQGHRPTVLFSTDGERTCSAYTVSDENETELLFRCHEGEIECGIFVSLINND